MNIKKTTIKDTEIKESMINNTAKSDVKGTVKDSLFRDLFGNRKYALQLYKAIHPEDVAVTEMDITNVTINNVFTDQEYNDLGMTVRDKVLILLEAQSTWSMNIIVRILFYLTHTWNQYLETTQQNRYSTTKIQLPKPELYVIYTGDRKTRPEWIHLSKEFFNGNKDYLEANVKVLYGEGKDDILSQYVNFTKVYNAQIKLHGKTREAVLETIRICKNSDVLKEYLQAHEKEVIDIMMALFDQQKAVEQFGYEKMKEGEAKGRLEGEAKGKLESKKETAFNMKKKGYPDIVIADILEVGTHILREWFEGVTTAKP